MRGERGLPVPLVAYFGPWEETLARWRREGLGERDWAQAAGFEDGPQHPVPVSAYLSPLFDEQTLAQDSTCCTVRDKHGVVKRLHRVSESMPQFLRHPLETRADWCLLKPRLSNPNDPARFLSDWQGWLAESGTRDSVLFLGMLPCGFFGALRELMGLQRALTSFYDDPALVEDVLDTLCLLWCNFYPMVLRQVAVDFVFIWEDMCYRGGLLISPATFRRFLLLRYQKLAGRLRREGVENIHMDSDGDLTQLIPLWLEGGINGAQPLEIASGLNLPAIAKCYPRLQLVGGIDKRALAAGPEAINRELAKVPPLLERGRYMPAVDHGVPPDVSWANYCYFARQLGGILGDIDERR